LIFDWYFIAHYCLGRPRRPAFATLRERLIKIGARVIEHIARIRVQLPTSCPEGALFRAVALGLMPSGP
jgi:Transposase DDE domain group 1